MKFSERITHGLDAWQQSHSGPALVVGVARKFSDDNAGTLVTSIAFAGFVALFPLLLILFTVLGLVLANDPHARASITHSAVSQFPLIGNQLESNIHVLQRTSTLGLIVGILVLVWGSMGLAQAGQQAMARVWNVPKGERPKYGARLIRSLEFLGVLGAGVLVTTILAGFGTFGRHNVALGLVGEVLAALVNCGQYLLAFRILTPAAVSTRSLVPGSMVGGVGWTILQALGGFVVGHYLRHAGEVYGTFGTVLGLLAWIYLGARLSVYAAELNAVLASRLWPRSLTPVPTTAADRRALDLLERGIPGRTKQPDISGS